MVLTVALFLASGFAPLDGDNAVDMSFVVDMHDRHIIMIAVSGFFVSVQ